MSARWPIIVIVATALASAQEPAGQVTNEIALSADMAEAARRFGQPVLPLSRQPPGLLVDGRNAHQACDATWRDVSAVPATVPFAA